MDDDDVKRFRHRDSYVHLLREMKENRLNKKKARSAIFITLQDVNLFSDKSKKINK